MTCLPRNSWWFNNVTWKYPKKLYNKSRSLTSIYYLSIPLTPTVPEDLLKAPCTSGSGEPLFCIYVFLFLSKGGLHLGTRGVKHYLRNVPCVNIWSSIWPKDIQERRSPESDIGMFEQYMCSVFVHYLG